MADIVVHNIIDHTQHFSFHEIDNALASILVAAGIATYAAAKKAVPNNNNVEWDLIRLPHSGKPAIRHTKDGVIAQFAGEPGIAKTGFQAQVWQDGKYVLAGPVPPADIIAQYKAMVEGDERDKDRRLAAWDKPKTSYK